MKDRPWVISSTCTRLKFVFSCFILGALFCFRNCTTQHRLCLPIRYGLFFLHPPLPCSPFYGSTTSNSCLGRETNYVCDQFRLWCDLGSQFPPSASRVDQLIFCMSNLFPFLWQYNKKQLLGKGDKLHVRLFQMWCNLGWPSVVFLCIWTMIRMAVLRSVYEHTAVNAYKVSLHLALF